MFTNIFGSNNIVIQGGSPSIPYVSSSSVPYAVDNRVCYNGDIRFVNGSYQIFNSGGWHMVHIGSNPTVDVSFEIKQVLEWAKKRMAFEQEVETLAEQYSSVKLAKDQLDMVLALVKDHK